MRGVNTAAGGLSLLQFAFTDCLLPTALFDLAERVPTTLARIC